MCIRDRGIAAEMYGSKEKPGRHKRINGLQNIDKIIDINQAPIGRTPRSNPATYTGDVYKRQGLAVVFIITALQKRHKDFLYSV